jgi:large subunit ribosomal protein L23
MNIRILKGPHLTEKTVIQKDTYNQVTFLVDRDANKIEIKRAVESLFKVTVLDVHTINTLGKQKRMGRYAGRRPDWKKAMVTLKQGDRIEYFEGA